MRYHIHGHFVEDRIPDGNHFPVHHTIEVVVETFTELQDRYDSFLLSYNSRCCYGLTIGISEDPSAVE
jgi:hypothetical protein